MADRGKKLIMNGQTITFEHERNIIEVAKKAGIIIPTFCYHSSLSVYGACRICTVEVEGKGFQIACATPPRDGMIIKTNTDRIFRLRRMLIELLLANHDRDCTTCERSGNCKLQELSNALGITNIRFDSSPEREIKPENAASIVRNPNKCILCGDCVRMCQEVQSIGVIGFTGRAAETRVEPPFNKSLADVDCVECGQCTLVCPTAALTIKSNIDKVWSLLHNPQITVVAQIAPAIRTSLGEVFGITSGTNVLGQLSTALKQLGFDYVFDTCVGADIHILEESKEFSNRLKSNEHLPLITSCCPVRVRFIEQYFSNLIPNLSTVRSPQQILGSIIKRFYCREKNISPKNMAVISLMPCTAKRSESERQELSNNGIPDVDVVLSTRELISMLRQAGIDLARLPSTQLDNPLGNPSGAGIIFGVTGGVVEAILRTLYEKTDSRRQKIAFNEVRGNEFRRETSIRLNGKEVKIVIVNTLKEAKRLFKEISDGKVDYHLAEVIVCPGGCVGGGGQPIPKDTFETPMLRGEGLYKIDESLTVRTSLSNPDVRAIYERWLRSEKCRLETLHTHYTPRRRISAEAISLWKGKEEEKTVIEVCVGTSCYLKGSYDLIQLLTQKIKSLGLTEHIDVKATFCMEKCNKGPTIRVDNDIITNINPDKVEDIVSNLIVPIVKGERVSQERILPLDRKFQRVNEIIVKYKNSSANLIPILQETQEEYRYLPKETMIYIANCLDIPVSSIYGLATFYAQFSLIPKGKHLIRVCDGTACHVKNADDIIEVIYKRTGLSEDMSTTNDMLITLEKVGCLGACALAPVAVIDGKVYGHLTPEKMTELVDTILGSCGKT